LRKGCIITGIDLGRKPSLFKTTSLHQVKKEDLFSVKDGLTDLEEEMNSLRALIMETNSRLSG